MSKGLQTMDSRLSLYLKQNQKGKH